MATIEVVIPIITTYNYLPNPDCYIDQGTGGLFGHSYYLLGFNGTIHIPDPPVGYGYGQFGVLTTSGKISCYSIEPVFNQQQAFTVHMTDNGDPSNINGLYGTPDRVDRSTEHFSTSTQVGTSIDTTNPDLQGANLIYNKNGVLVRRFAIDYYLWQLFYPIGSDSGSCMPYMVDGFLYTEMSFVLTLFANPIDGGGGTVSPGGAGLWNTRGSQDSYHRVNRELLDNGDQQLQYSMTRFASPAYGFEIDGVPVTDGKYDAEARMIVYENDIIYLIFTRDVRDDDDNFINTDVWEVSSADEGMTWEEPALMFQGGIHPTIAIISEGILRAAYIANEGGDIAGGVIVGTYQGSGDIDPSDEFTFKTNLNSDITVKGDTFHVTQAPEGPSRAILVCVELNNTEVSEFESTDDCRTWKRIDR